MYKKALIGTNKKTEAKIPVKAESGLLYDGGGFNLSSNLNRERQDIGQSLVEVLNFSLEEIENLGKYSRDKGYVRLNKRVSDIGLIAYFGSLEKRLREAVIRIILNFPGSLFVTQTGTTLGYTVTHYTFYQGIASFFVPLEHIINKQSENRTITDFVNMPSGFELLYNGRTYVIESIAFQVFDGVNGLRARVVGDPFEIGFGDTPLRVHGFSNESTETTFISNNGEEGETEYYYFKGEEVKGDAQSLDPSFHFIPKKEAFFAYLDALPDLEAYIVSEKKGDSFFFELEYHGTENKVVKEFMWPVSDGYNPDIRTSAFIVFFEALVNLGREHDRQGGAFKVKNYLPEALLADEGIMAYCDVIGRNMDELRYLSITYAHKSVPGFTFQKEQAFSWVPDTLEEKSMGGGELVASHEMKVTNLANERIADTELKLWREIIQLMPYLNNFKGTRRAAEEFLSLLGVPPSAYSLEERVYVVVDGTKYSGLVDMDKGREGLFDQLSTSTAISKLLVDNKKSWAAGGGLHEDVNYNTAYTLDAGNLLVNSKEVYINFRFEEYKESLKETYPDLDPLVLEMVDTLSVLMEKSFVPFMEKHLFQGTSIIVNSPLAPVYVKDIMRNGATLNLNWYRPMETVDAFEVERSRDPLFRESVVKEVLGTVYNFTETIEVDEALYYYRIRARNGETYSPWPALKEIYVPLMPPLGVVSDFTPEGFKLSWSSHSLKAAFTEIQRAENAAFTEYVSFKTGAALGSYLDHTVVPGKTYYYRLRNISPGTLSGFVETGAAFFHQAVGVLSYYMSFDKNKRLVAVLSFNTKVSNPIVSTITSITVSGTGISYSCTGEYKVKGNELVLYLKNNVKNEAGAESNILINIPSLEDAVMGVVASGTHPIVNPYVVPTLSGARLLRVEPDKNTLEFTWDFYGLQKAGLCYVECSINDPDFVSPELYEIRGTVFRYTKPNLLKDNDTLYLRVRYGLAEWINKGFTEYLEYNIEKEIKLEADHSLRLCGGSGETAESRGLRGYSRYPQLKAVLAYGDIYRQESVYSLLEGDTYTPAIEIMSMGNHQLANRFKGVEKSFTSKVFPIYETVSIGYGDINLSDGHCTLPSDYMAHLQVNLFLNPLNKGIKFKARLVNTLNMFGKEVTYHFREKGNEEWVPYTGDTAYAGYSVVNPCVLVYEHRATVKDGTGETLMVDYFATEANGLYPVSVGYENSMSNKVFDYGGTYLGGEVMEHTISLVHMEGDSWGNLLRGEDIYGWFKLKVDGLLIINRPVANNKPVDRGILYSDTYRSNGFKGLSSQVLPGIENRLKDYGKTLEIKFYTLNKAASLELQNVALENYENETVNNTPPVFLPKKILF